MNKTIIRIAAFILLVSPWIYIGSSFKDMMYMLLAVIIMSCTIDISKRKKVDGRDQVSD